MTRKLEIIPDKFQQSKKRATLSWLIASLQTYSRFIIAIENEKSVKQAVVCFAIISVYFMFEISGPSAVFHRNSLFLTSAKGEHLNLDKFYS